MGGVLTLSAGITSAPPAAAGKERPARRPWDHLAAAAWALGRPPVHDRRFWAIQALIVLIALAGYAVDVRPPHRPLLSFLLVTLFFVPATDAASTFGFRGSLATSLWCVAVDAPFIVAHHVGMERLAELLQLAAISGIAVFVGSRVDREAAARRHAEAARAAVEVSEAKYRGLFEASPLPILVVGPEGRVRALNPAASTRWGRAGDGSTSLSDLVGRDCAQTPLAMA